jgi:hypothetical protein
MGLKVTNNAFGTLNAGINDSVTTVVLAAGQGSLFPTLTAGDYFYATLIDTSNNLEIVKVTARSTDTMTIVRAQDNTTARAYSTNDRFELRPTAALFNEKANAADVAATYVELAGDTMTGPLEIQSTNSNVLKIHKTGVSALGVSPLMDFQVTQTNSQSALLGRIAAEFISNWGGALLFYTKPTNGSPDNSVTEHMRIDSSGRVTMPNQPAFEAVFTNGYSIGGGTTMVPSIVNLNKGGHYNSSNGRFTAPVTGTYLIAANIRYVAGYYSWTFNVNGSVIRYYESVGPGTAQSTNDGYAFVKYLVAGDYVTIVTGSAGISSDAYASFSGALLS